MQSSDEFFRIRVKQGVLIPGEIAEGHFCLLMEISSIRSERMVQALHEYLVKGKSRIAVCKKNGLGSSHFSISLDRVQRLSYLVSQLSRFYQK